MCTDWLERFRSLAGATQSIYKRSPPYSVVLCCVQCKQALKAGSCLMQASLVLGLIAYVPNECVVHLQS
jgi:hypothetical protein